MDERFHRALHVGTPGRHHLAVLNHHRPHGHFFDALFHDVVRLAHFLHAHHITVVAVAVLADRNLKIEIGIAFVRLRTAQIPGDARRAQHHPRHPPGERVAARHHADIDIALLEDPVVGEKALDVIEHFGEMVAERVDILQELRRQVLVHAAHAEIIGVHARARRALIEYHQLLAFLEAPKRRRQRADIHGLGGDLQQMIEQTPDLAIKHTDILRARRNGQAKQPRAAEWSGQAASRPQWRKRAPDSWARRNRAGRNTESLEDKSCARSAFRCRDEAGRYAGRPASRLHRRVPAPGARRHGPRDAAARN